jgi:tetratricopeptide (TPR) repeat protein
MKFKLIFFFLVFTLSLSARKPDDGEVFFNNKQYLKARPIYESLLKQRPNDALYNYRYARCCYELKDYEAAIVHFEMCGSKLPLRDLYLGDSYHNTYRFEEAATAYQAFVATLKLDDSKLPDYQRKIKLAEAGARLLTKVDDIAIVDSAVVNKSEFLKFYKFSSELGSLRQELLKLTPRRSADKVRYTTQRQDRVYYSDSIHGHMNIFTSYKLLDTWSEAASISDVINTSANENYPFLLLDGVTLYFASDGENSLGGYDLFVTRFTPATNSYLPPENIGFPFNSPYNDYMMVIDEQRKIGWFASDRFQPAGKVMIYSFVPNATKSIVRSEDKDYIRRVAQLKSYRKVASDKSENMSSVENGASEPEKQMEFVINDSVVYTHSNQFKSENADQILREFYTLVADQKTLEAELTALREKYATMEPEAERKALTQSILELEYKNRQAEKQLSAKNVELRNNENIYLQQHK